MAEQNLDFLAGEALAWASVKGLQMQIDDITFTHAPISLFPAAVATPTAFVLMHAQVGASGVY
jgi:hypothetical protein